MPFYLAWIYLNFNRWNFQFFTISDLSCGTNQDFMPFIQAQFFVARYPQKLHSEWFSPKEGAKKWVCRCTPCTPGSVAPVKGRMSSTYLNALF